MVMRWKGFLVLKVFISVFSRTNTLNEPILEWKLLPSIMCTLSTSTFYCTRLYITYIVCPLIFFNSFKFSKRCREWFYTICERLNAFINVLNCIFSFAAKEWKINVGENVLNANLLLGVVVHVSLFVEYGMLDNMCYTSLGNTKHWKL